MPWWLHVKRYTPAQVTPRSVYELEDYRKDGVVFVVAPGPSLDLFPKSELKGRTTIGVNSALELAPLEFWIFQEGIIGKKYFPLYSSGLVKNVVTTRDRAEFLYRILPKEVNLFRYCYFDTSVLRMEKDVGFHPFWKRPNEFFLPGRCSITANALSLAVLMKPALVVCVGLDMAMPDGKYYADGVKRNPGPRLKEKALSVGSSWMWIAAKKGVWSGPRIITTSPWLRMPRFKRVSVEDALKEVERNEQGLRHNPCTQ